MRRLLPLLALALVTAFALTGCLKIEQEAVTQDALIGDVTLVTTICLSSNTADCPLSDSNQQNSVDETGTAFQLLVAYRVPVSAVAAPTITAAYKPPNTGSVDLAASPAYTSELQAKAAPPAGQKWAGYASRPITLAERIPAARVEVRAPFKLGRGADGSPFAGPFSFRTVAGYDPKRRPQSRVWMT